MTESNFRAICDLLQDIGRTDIQLSYSILAEYVPMVRAAGHRDWVHILLMGWAKAKESLTDFADAEALYREARENAAGDDRRYDEALVGTVLLYAEWGRVDSLRYYERIGKAAAARARDRENLSFLYTFGAVADASDSIAMGQGLRKAMELARDLPNKNALFTATYNYASIYSRNNPQRQVVLLQSLLSLAQDPTLTHRYRLYERTAFSFRNPVPNIYLQLMQVNLLLTDYENAGKFGQLLYDAVVGPNPSAPQAPFFTSELAIIKAYQGQYTAAREYLQESRRLFKVPEDKIAYPSYFLAAGMIAEQEGKNDSALHYYSVAYRTGGMEGLHLMPSEIYYARALIRAGRLGDASRVLDSVRQGLPGRLYTAYGYYYYEQYAGLLKAKGDLNGYGKALEQYYAIKDSLADLNHYRAIEEIEARVRLRDKERQIDRLNEEQLERAHNQRLERIYIGIVAALGILSVALFVYVLKRRHRIEVMQGAMDAEQRERYKIADQLHDEVGGLLSLTTLNLSSALEKGQNGGPQLQKAQETLVAASATVREISHRLTPLVIEKYGFRVAMEDLAGSVNVSGKLVLELVMVGFEDTSGYPEGLLNEIYRMVQELIQNILRHAQATQALVQLVEHPGAISILVEDDGVGMGQQAMPAGRGLDTIRRKIAYLKGRIGIDAKNEKGTLIMIEIPFASKNSGRDGDKNTYSG